MNTARLGSLSNGICKVVKLLLMGAAVLVMTLTIPARASDARAVKSRVAAVYPEMAKRMKIAGAVHLAVTVDPEGKVTDVKTVTGNSMLAHAAEDAVRKWRFVPGPDVSTVDVEINFTLSE